MLFWSRYVAFANFAPGMAKNQSIPNHNLIFIHALRARTEFVKSNLANVWLDIPN